MKKLRAKGLEIAVIESKDDDYISLTDMAKYKEKESTGLVIAHWLTTKYTVQFMGAWEKLCNPDFNVTEFSNIKNEIGSNGFILSASKWINKTRAIGVRSNPGRYGGTFAHKDIAFEFATWLSPEFKLYLIKEFQRLKNEEGRRGLGEWDTRRFLTKMNYRIHTDAVREHLIPLKLNEKQILKIYANEADVLNKALFGLTAKEWRAANPFLKGNVRDYSDVTQLICLANLESLNAEFIRQGMDQSMRLLRLNEIAIIQMRSLVGGGKKLDS